MNQPPRSREVERSREEVEREKKGAVVDIDRPLLLPIPLSAACPTPSHHHITTPLHQYPPRTFSFSSIYTCRSIGLVRHSSIVTVDVVVDTQTMFATHVTQTVHSSRSSFAGSVASFSTSKTVVRAPVQQLRVEGMFGDGHLVLARHATGRCPRRSSVPVPPVSRDFLSVLS